MRALLPMMRPDDGRTESGMLNVVYFSFLSEMGPQALRMEVRACSDVDRADPIYDGTLIYRDEISAVFFYPQVCQSR